MSDVINTPETDKFDVAIIGGGILGTTLAYWLSSYFQNAKIALLEKENDVGLHTSSRNTGVVHRPFYLDPKEKKIFARSALLSYPLWRKYTQAKGIPWEKIGTIEVAIDKSQLQILEKYREWAFKNGMREEEIDFLSQKTTQKIEPNVICVSAFLCKTDVATDFGLLTKSLKEDSQNKGVKFLMNSEVEVIKEAKNGLNLICKNGAEISTRYLINCAGGNATKIAHLLGVAREFTDLNFRGEYWVVDPCRANLANHNIYSVPRHTDLPFLDPHWVVRWNGQVEIGPNAVPVIGPYTYEGFFDNIAAVFKKFFEYPRRNKLLLLFNPEFLRLATEEWEGSLSKKAMVGRIQRFLPKIKTEFLIKRGLAGIRSSVIDKNGTFVKEALEFFGPFSFHMINFNSPGATGVPAYTAYIMKKMINSHKLEHLKKRKVGKETMWDFSKISDGFDGT